MSPKLAVVVGVIFFKRKERDTDRGRNQVETGTGMGEVAVAEGHLEAWCRGHLGFRLRASRTVT